MENINWTEYLKQFFGNWINEKGQITMKLIAKHSIEEYQFYTIKELVNPKYSTFEMIKKILKHYDDYCGGSEIASQNSNHYNNLLICLGCIYDNVDEETLEFWNKRFCSKFILNNRLTK